MDYTFSAAHNLMNYLRQYVCANDNNTLAWLLQGKLRRVIVFHGKPGASLTQLLCAIFGSPPSRRRRISRL